MGFISGLIDVVDHLGRRLITPNSLGRYQPVRLKLWPGASTTCTDRGDGTSELQIAAPSDVLSYATAADFRAATPPADGTFFRVVSPAGEYRYSTSSGAGWADDNDTILKPNSVLIGSNGRAFSTRASAHAATFTAARSMKGLVVSGIRHVHIESHTTFGDGGGGVFDVRDASVDPDDNGLVIQAAAGVFLFRRDDKNAPVNVRWFGAQGDDQRTVPGTDDTAAMTAAHATGRVVFYPRGHYRFTKFSFTKGGIIGEGRVTQLWCRDTTADHAITYAGNDETDTQEIDNPVGPVFRDFFMCTPAAGSKSGGAGIRIDPGVAARPTDCPMSRNAIFSNVAIRYLPIGISLSNATAFTIDDCRLHYNSIYGIYEDQPIPIFEDNGDNTISNCSIIGSTNTICVKYRGGGLRCWGNKILLGLVGVDLSPLRSSSILKLFGNSIEAQSATCVRFITEGDTAAVAFSQVQICDNIFTVLSAGVVITVAPVAFTLLDLQINSNIIRTLNTSAANALSVAGCSRFTVVGNEFYGNGSYRAVATTATATAGKISANLYSGFSFTALVADATVTEDPFTQTSTETTVTNTPYGSFYSGTETVTFPVPFRSAPKVQVTLAGFSNGELSCGATNVTATTFDLTVIGTANGGSLATAWRAEGLPV